jgi:hypothetical protein
MLGVVAAAAVLLVLAGSLAGRLAVQAGETMPQAGRPFGEVEDPGAPPPAYVPPPRTIHIDELPTPFCWTCPGNAYHPLEFQVDLDLLAPLGDGPANAALWLRQFAKGDGPRCGEGQERIRKIEVKGETWKVFPPDDPLLLEAEAWVDQARCRFYPDVWELSGFDTPITNLLFVLNLARSWVARGRLSEDPQAAVEDYRRAIRLGRLLRQDDLTLIQDLVAIACIRIGVEALYDHARSEGDAATMTATALVLADRDAMRHFAARRTTLSYRILGALEVGWFGGLSLHATEGQVHELVEQARRVSERRYRLEAMLGLQVVRHLGTEKQRAEVLDVYDEWAASDDAMTAELARRMRDEPLDEAELRRQVEEMK